MIITFCGHADFLKSKDCEEKFLRWLGEIVGEKRVEMYLGGYGNFDHLDSCLRQTRLGRSIRNLLIR